MNQSLNRFGAILIAALANFATPTLQAQNLDETMPPLVLPPPEDPAPPTYGENSISTKNGELVILDKLKSIRLLTDTGDKDDSAAEEEAKNVIENFVTPALKPYIDKPLTIAGLIDIKATAQKIYNQNSQAIVRVVLPEQEITSGEILLAAITARVGKVDSINTRAKDQTRLKHGEVLNRQTLVDDIDWLSRPSKKTASALLQPGANPGETDVNLIIDTKPKPWTVFASLDNHGVDLLGRDRWTFGATHSDLFGKDVEVLYQYMTDADREKLDAHFASITIPVRDLRHEIRWLGYIAKTIGNRPDEIRIGGKSWQSSFEYRIPIPRAFDRKLRHEFVFGYDAKGANSDLEFGLFNLLRTNTEIHQFQFGYEGDWKDKLGRTSLDLSLVLSPGGFSPANDDAAFRTARADSESDYTYLDLKIDRLINLPAGFQIFTELAARAASNNLLPSEQLALSGPSAVRGFEPSRIRGDSGLVSRTELRTPGFSALKKNDSWQPFAFLDFGRGNSVDPLPDEETLSLGSSGLGLRMEWHRSISGELIYGWQIAENNFDDQNDGRFQARMTIQW